MKFLYYLTVLVVLAYLAWRFRDQLRDGWQRFLNELQWLREKWGHLPPSTENAKESIDTVPVRRARPFSEFSNPFRHRGGAERSPEELLRYTFSALEAWGREHEVERRAEETPLEFAQRLGVKHPEVARVGRDVSLLYSQLAYGPGELPRETAQHLQRFWRLIELRQSELDRMIAS